MPISKHAAALAGLGALGAAGVVAYSLAKKPVTFRQTLTKSLRSADLELQPEQPEQTTTPHLRLATITWDNPQVITTVTAGTSQLMSAQYAHGGTGYMTLLGTLWVPAGPNGDLFYYELWVDGNMVDRIFRVVGAGSSVSQTSGIPSPSKYDPPLSFRDNLRLICFNNDVVDHVAETYVGGYTRRHVPT